MLLLQKKSTLLLTMANVRESFENDEPVEIVGLGVP
jgi:hypothetical protein